MKKRWRTSSWGCLAIIAGIVIMLSLIMPTGFWWFILAIALIVFGIFFMKSC